MSPILIFFIFVLPVPWTLTPVLLFSPWTLNP